MPRPTVGASLLRAAGAVSKSEEGGECAVVWRSLPACEHDFPGKRLRPARVRGVPLVARASPLVAGLGRGVERCQGGELGQVALVEFVGVLYGGQRGRKEEAEWEKKKKHVS